MSMMSLGVQSEWVCWWWLFVVWKKKSRVATETTETICSVRGVSDIVSRGGRFDCFISVWVRSLFRKSPFCGFRKNYIRLSMFEFRWNHEMCYIWRVIFFRNVIKNRGKWEVYNEEGWNHGVEEAIKNKNRFHSSFKTYCRKDFATSHKGKWDCTFTRVEDFVPKKSSSSCNAGRTWEKERLKQKKISRKNQRWQSQLIASDLSGWKNSDIMHAIGLSPLRLPLQ